MVIDLVVGSLAVLAAFWGYRRGLILAVFSLVATVLGVLLAFKFSSLVAVWLEERTHLSDRWLPLVAFMAVMIGVILIVRLGAKALEGMLELAQLGLLNRLAGLLLYLILTLSVAALVFYVVQWGGVIPSEISDESWFAQYVQPFFIEGLKKAAQRMPGFREMFQQFEHFFEQLPS